MLNSKKLRHLILDAMISVAVIFGLSESRSDPTLALDSPELSYAEALQTGSNLPTIIKDHPKYPHAQITDFDNSSPNENPLFMTFDTTDKPEDVQAYYRDSLLGDGWKFIENDKTGLMWLEWRKFYHYYWGPPEHNCIYCYDAYIFARNQPDYLVETNAIVSIVQTAPIYPYAKQVETYEDNQADIGRISTFVKFTTTDKPETVLRFYEGILSKVKWPARNLTRTPEYWHVFPYLIAIEEGDLEACSDIPEIGYYCFNAYSLRITIGKAGETNVSVSRHYGH